MTMSPSFIPDPPIGPETEHYWTAAAEERLLVRRCNACDRPHHYPRAHCPYCRSTDLAWIETAGTGMIYAVSVMARAKEPYALAYVTLPEGVTMLTNIVDADLSALHIGDAVRVVFRPSKSGTSVPFFTPA